MNTNTDLYEQLQNEACRLGDELLAEAETDSKGMFWQTMHMGDKGEISFCTANNIYGGVPGITLFLLELYKKTSKKAYLDAAKNGINWAIAEVEKKEFHYASFLTGELGIAFVLTRLYEITKDKSYLDKANSLALSLKDIIINTPGDDFISGLAGIIVGLLHLHAATGANWILETLDYAVRILLARANHGPLGLYWERSNNNINGLCGFAHGSAGIGFAFLELGHYFHNHTFYWLAEQAFLYERAFFNHHGANKNNWPDLRRGIFLPEDREEHRKNYLEGNMSFFTVGGDMNAWCHGAAGIGLARLRALQLFPHPIYEEEARAAIEKTTTTNGYMQMDAATFILCHGGGGNADLFLYAYETLKNPDYLANAEKIATYLLEYYKMHKKYLPGFRNESNLEDRSLFMGNAGIGYFLLRVLDPLAVPSILIPEVKMTCAPGLSLTAFPFLTLSTAELLKELIKKDFSRTLRVGETAASQEVAAFFYDYPLSIKPVAPDTRSLIQDFMAFNERLLASLPEDSVSKEKFSEAFFLEKEKREMDENIKSFCWESIKTTLLSEQAEELNQKPDEEFLKLNFQLEPAVKLFTTHWNWNLELTENPEMPEDEYWLVLLKPSALQIIEIELNAFSYAILFEFQEFNSVEQVVETTVDAFEELSAEEEESVRCDILQQIKQALSAGILIQP